MSEQEYAQQETSRSSIRITLNAKREAQVEVKVRVGDTAEEVAHAREIAVAQYRQTLADLIAYWRRDVAATH